MVEKKNKTLFLSILGLIVLLLLVGGVTYAFYNYTKTGGANILKTGSMNFYSNYEEATLQNVYPIPEHLVDTDTDNVMELEVTVSGKITHTSGMEYAISLTDIKASVDNIDVPISVKSSATNLGTQDSNYFTSRGGSDLLYFAADGTVQNDEYFFVGYIPTSSTNVSGTISIKVYLDSDKIGVSDTYDGTESKTNGTKNSWADGKVILTESQWSTLRTNGITFKIKVEAYNGVWVKGSLYNIIYQKQKSGVDYLASYEDLRQGNFTSLDAFRNETYEKEEVIFYTGGTASANSNVLFAGYCWNIMRTTDNGGVRLIYNGKAEDDKCKTNRAVPQGIKNNSIITDFDLSNEVLYGDGFDYDLTSKNFTLLNSTAATYSSATAKDLMGKWTCNSSNEDTCSTIYYVGHMTSNTTAVVASYEINELSNYTQLSKSYYNVANNSVSYVGYMYNAVYIQQEGLKEGTFWSYVKWNEQNQVYELADDGTSSENIGTTYHYICDDENCTKVRYYFSHQTVDGDTYYYVLLENGSKDPLTEMTNIKIFNEPDVNINVYDSVAKSVIDNWYRKELLSYSAYIDKDAIYCNDRSPYSSISNVKGWRRNKDLESSVTDVILFNQRSSTNKTNLSCPREIDSFSSSANNTKAYLKYPVGLVTETERYLMGGTYSTRSDYWWTMTPYNSTATEVKLENIRINSGSDSRGKPTDTNVLRPVITLKADTKIASGVGSYESPYIIA